MNFNNLDQLYRSVIMDHYKTLETKANWITALLLLI